MKHILLVCALAGLLGACATPATPAPSGAAAPPAATAGPAATPNSAAQPHIDAARKALLDKDFDHAVSEAQAAVASDPNAALAVYTLGNALNQQAAVEPDASRRAQLLDLAADAIGVSEAELDLQALRWQRRAGVGFAGERCCAGRLPLGLIVGVRPLGAAETVEVVDDAGGGVFQ